MAATAITTTAQDITGDFDITVRGNYTDSSKTPTLLKALGSSGANFVEIYSFLGEQHVFCKNTGTNAYKLKAAISGVTVEFSQ